MVSKQLQSNGLERNSALQFTNSGLWFRAFFTFRVTDDVDTHRRNRVPGQERYKHKLFKIAATRCMSWGEL
jgi:hypothetical protein